MLANEKQFLSLILTSSTHNNGGKTSQELSTKLPSVSLKWSLTYRVSEDEVF